MVDNFSEKADFIWEIADLLRGDYKQSEYQKVILPLTVLRRLDCVTEPTKDEVLARAEELEDAGIENKAPMLKDASGEEVYNTSEYTFESLCSDPDNIAENLQYYKEQYDEDTKEIFEKFDFDHQIRRLDDADLLYKVVRQFSEIDLHPDEVPNEEMGYVYEELIRKFNELSNETAGEHFTPREVIELMVNLIFDEDDEVLSEEGAVRTVYDPACGTGGMLSVAQDHVRELNGEADLHVFGQELNPESYAVCNSDMLIKGQNPDNIVYGNSFTDDGFDNREFDYMLSNPPFGVSWKKVKDYIEREHEEQGYAGRFGAGTPRVSDGAFLFLQHMLSKMKDSDDGGSRVAIVFNGSPLFTGGPNSGESAIRRWIIENDWLEAIVGLPENLFYNTGIHTYIWVLSNDKPEHRAGKIQLIDAREMYEEMDESLGEKRHELSQAHIDEITEIFGDLEANGRSKVLDNEEFGYRRIVIDRPLRMSFQATEERIESLHDERAFTNRDEATQEAVKEALYSLNSDNQWMDRDEFMEEVELVFNMHGVDVRNSVYNAVERALGERNEDAEIVTDSKGRPEHDSNLRDRERVPLDEDPKEYFQEHIKPKVQEAWINEDQKYHDEKDGELGVVGYEINFDEYFFEYSPPRRLSEIDKELNKLEEKIEDGFDELTSSYHYRSNLESTGNMWLGEIPSDWDVSRLNYLRDPYTPIAYGIVQAGPDQDNGIPVIKGGDCKPERLDPAKLSKTTPEIASKYERAKLEKNDLVYEIRGSVGRVIKVPEVLEGANLTQDTARISPSEDVNEDWLLYALQSEPFNQQMELYMRGATVQGVNLRDLRRGELPVPSTYEQQNIASYLKETEEQINDLKERLEEGIDLLKEKREAILAEAITGKIRPEFTKEEIEY